MHSSWSISRRSARVTRASSIGLTLVLGWAMDADRVVLVPLGRVAAALLGNVGLRLLPGSEQDVKLARLEGAVGRLRVVEVPGADAVQIGKARLPVVGVAHVLGADPLLERFHDEGAGADDRLGRGQLVELLDDLRRQHQGRVGGQSS